MTITLDDATEKKVQRELDRGRFADTSQLLAHAVDLLTLESDDQEDPEAYEWLLRNRDAIREGVAASTADFEAGRSYSEQEVKARFASRLAGHAA